MKYSHSHTQTSVSLFWSSLLLVKRDLNQFQDISIWNRIFKIQWDYSTSSSSHFSFIFFFLFSCLTHPHGKKLLSRIRPQPWTLPHLLSTVSPSNLCPQVPERGLETARVVVYPANAFAWFSGVEFTRDKVFISPCQPRPWGLRLAGNLVVHCWSVVKGEGGREGFFSWSRTVSRWCHWRETTSWTRNLVRD